MNRRNFIKLSALGLAGCVAPTVVATATPSARPTRTRTPTPAPTPVPTTQTFSIQAMIDEASDGGIVNVPPGGYDVTQTIQCAPGVSLNLTGVTLNLRADVDVIHCAHRANITGGFIDCSQVTFTHAALVLDGASKFDMTFPTFFSDIRMLGNWQSYAETGTGVLMKSDSGFIQGVTFSNIGVSYFRNGIRLEASPGCWVNGNHFSNLTIMICRYAVSLNANAGGNTFTNVQYQPDDNCVRALYCEGGANMLTNFFVWDWNPNIPAIEFTAGAMRNYITTDLYGQYVLDNGWNNKFVNPDN